MAGKRKSHNRPDGSVVVHLAEYPVSLRLVAQALMRRRRRKQRTERPA